MEKVMTRSARICAAVALLLAGTTFAVAQNGPPTGGYHPPDGTPIFMATTATPIILATTVTILSTPPCLATGTITKLARRGAVMTRSRLVERPAQGGYAHATTTCALNRNGGS
jgi:hypothetical protein